MHHTPNKRLKGTLALASLLFILTSAKLFAEETEFKLYRPFAQGSLEVPLQITSKLQGECILPSHRLPREDTWRCVAESKVYDPCFIKQYSDRKLAICPHSPWDGRGVEINLARAADNHQRPSLDISRTFPWALELADGTKCLSLPRGMVYDDLPVHYRCEDQSILYGPMQRCRTPWTMLQNVGTSVQTGVIKRAWF